MSLFNYSRFGYPLHSGGLSTWKIDCDSLTTEDIISLRRIIVDRIGPFSAVEGVGRGGTRLAEFLEMRCSPEGPLLIVDDVLTTGASMEEQRAGREAIGVVLFARGKCPPWVKAVFTSWEVQE